MEGDDAARPSVFYFERPAVSPIYLPEANASSEHEKVITDHLLDYAEMDLGWIKANGPSVFDGRSYLGFGKQGIAALPALTKS